jgi:serine/threonine-protein kinase
MFHEGALYLVMDYVEGDSLAGVLKRARSLRETLPIPVVGRILADLLHGLHAAHEHMSADGLPLGLVHRDVSPENVLVGIDGVSRIGDFGIAKARDSSSDTSANGAPDFGGDVSYLAPEQALGMPLDRRCDLWAAGVIAWEALAGRRLHAQQMDVAALLTLISDPPPALRMVRSDIPEPIERLFERVLRVNASERFRSADDFRVALLAAWNACGGIAATDVVASYVQDLLARTPEASESAPEPALTA